MTIRALVVDDQALVRGSFRILVDTAPDLTSVGETANGTEAVELARRLIAEFTRHPETRLRPMAALDHITEREREVLTLIGLGLSNTEIAARLHVSLSTAKTHVGRLLMKVGARDRAQLVIAAYDAGLVHPA